MKIISTNPKRNMQQVVLHNTDENGKTQSVTAHIPMDDTRFVRHKNHSYEKGAGWQGYRQPANVKV